MVLIDIGREQALSILLRQVYDLSELLPIAGQQIFVGKPEHIFDLVYVEFVKDVQRVLLYGETAERGLPKAVVGADNGGEPPILPRQQHGGLDRAGDRNATRHFLPLDLFNYLLGYLFVTADQPFQSAHVKQYPVIQHLYQISKPPRNGKQGLAVLFHIGRDDAGK